MKLVRAILFCIATVLLYLGVPLLGWGLGAIPEFLQSTARLGYAVLVGVFGVVVGIQAYDSTEGIRGRKGEEGKFVFRQSIVRLILVITLYLALFFIPFLDRRGIFAFTGAAIIGWLGVALTLFGFTLIYWSGLALGRQYSPDVTIQTDHRLITSSIYRYIRHPRYLGVIGLAIGISCVFRSWIGMVASLLCTAILLFRIRDEETVMYREFGNEWEAYCQRSWRLIPYIY